MKDGANAGATLGAAGARAVVISGGAPGDRIVLGTCEVRLERREGGGVLRLVTADGAQPLEIEVGPGGPLLRLRAGLGVVVEGTIAVAAHAVSLAARDEISLRSGGRIDLHAAGDLTSEGRDNSVIARAGDVAIRANDDVRLNGERIALNC